MQLTSPAARSVASVDGVNQAASAIPDVQQHAVGNTRVRRDTTRVTPPVVTANEDVPEKFIIAIHNAQVGPDSDAFERGYKTPTKVTVPGLKEGLSKLALMRLGVDQQLSPEQWGALKGTIEQRDIKNSQNNAAIFTKVLSGPEVRITPIAQGFYLSLVNQLSEGECAGLTHLLSLAVAEGKQQVFLDNLFLVLVNPDAPESQAFIHQLAKVHRLVNAHDKWGHDPATTRIAPYTDISKDLSASPTTKSLVITTGIKDNGRHRLSAGVIVDPQGGRSYYYSDVNGGFAQFSSREAFVAGMNKVFAKSMIWPNSELSDWYSSYEKKIFADAHFMISSFDPNVVPEISGDSNAVKFMYNAPLSGLDTIKVIDASGVSTSSMLGLKPPAPGGGALQDYEPVRQGLDKLHAASGMSQFHEAVNLLESIKRFTKLHPDSPQLSSMHRLQQALIIAISQAAAPVEFPYAFERIERQRVDLEEGKFGGQYQQRTEKLHGTKVSVKSSSSTAPDRVQRVFDAVNAALLKVQQSDPLTAKAVGAEIKVVIAKPGDRLESTLHLSKPTTLIIGDDFFAPVSAGALTVADRLGVEAQNAGGDAAGSKQSALIAGKLGMLRYYKSDSQGFLEVISNKHSFHPGDTLSRRAGRSIGDFSEETYTARLYDGKLDTRIEAELNRIFPPESGVPHAAPAAPASVRVADTGSRPTPVARVLDQGPAPASNKVPASSVAPLARINAAEVQRLKTLDDTRPLIKIGGKDVSRVDLYKMGAHIYGKPIESMPANDPDGRNLANTMQIEFTRLAAYLKSVPDAVAEQVSTVIHEVATTRDADADPLITRADGLPVPDALQKPILETSQKAAELRALVSSKKPMPPNFFSPGGVDNQGTIASAGLGFSAFSTFGGIRSAIESFQRGDTTTGAVALGSVVAEWGGVATEVALNKIAQKTLSRQAPSILGFKSSSMGKMIGKVTGGVGSVFSLPFDTYSAVTSFNKAARSTGKEAQDHYVNGAFAVANAATSIGLGVAFFAGFGAAGPAGLVVAGVLMAGQAIYSAVRAVEEIDKYTPLSGGQKFKLGLEGFLGFEPGFDVIKPYLEAKYSSGIYAEKKTRYEGLLSGTGKEHFERVIFGSSDVKVTQVPGKVPLTPFLWWSPPSWVLHEIKVPGKVAHVSVKDGSDLLTPTGSWNGKQIHAVNGVPGENKATLWDLGDGDDRVTGEREKPNYFLLGGGKKVVYGGDADDTVVFNADARQVFEQAQQILNTGQSGSSPRTTEIFGGEGRNTLSFTGPLSISYLPEGANEANGRFRTVDYKGHVIDLKTRSVSIITEKPDVPGVWRIATVHSFTNVETVPKGSSIVQGNNENNLFVLNGDNDVVSTGKGENIVIINGGADVTAEGGPNTYIIKKSHQGAKISDPGDSVIKLDYSAEQVSGWSVSDSGDLSVNLTGEAEGERQTLVIRNAFSAQSKDDSAPATFITNDDVMFRVSAPRKDGSPTRVPQVSGLKIDTGRFKA